MRRVIPWIVLGVLVVLTAFYAPAAYRDLRFKEQDPYQLVENLKAELAQLPAAGKLEVDSLGSDLATPSLSQADSMYPEPVPSKVFSQFDKLDCNAAFTGPFSKAEAKSLVWLDYLCGRKPLPKDFFDLPPSQHPNGGSWMNYAHIAKPEIAVDKQYLHIAETAEAGFLKDLTPGEIDMVMDKFEEFSVAGPYVFMRERDKASVDFRVYHRADWERLRSRSIVDLRRGDGANCVVTESWQSCWIIDTAKVERTRLILAGLIFALVFVLGWIIFQLLRERGKLQARSAADRLLMVQTLTHEIRHPCTGMRLSLEAFRDGYDSMDDKLKEEFLRMTTQMQKLQRVIVASEQYLQGGGGEQLFSFKKIKVDSVNDFIADVLEHYQGKIEIEPLKQDSAAMIDPYWFGMCVTNLVKNALMHGKQPIRAVAEMKNGVLMVSVIDSGAGMPGGKFNAGDERPRKSTAGGMGLGLSLVARIVRLMGGEISYRHQPKPGFTIKIGVGA